MGKIIVFEGIDGSGKKTQSNLLQARLIRENHHLFLLDFPQYAKQSSYFVRRYLTGDYGISADSVSSEQASLCYAMDRFDVFKTDKDVKKALEDADTILLANRYTTSNMLFQAAKAATKEEIYRLINWLYDLEYNILQIPKPDMVIMPRLEINKNMEIIRNRNIAQNAKANNMSTDIHESDTEYLCRVHAAGDIVAEYLGFEVIDCMSEDGQLRTIDDIHEEIYEKVMQLILK